MPEFKPNMSQARVHVYPCDRKLNLKEDVFSSDDRWQICLLDKDGKFLDVIDGREGVRVSKKVFPHFKKKLFAKESDCKVAFVHRYAALSVAPEVIHLQIGGTMQAHSYFNIPLKFDYPKFFAYLASQGKLASPENQGFVFTNADLDKLAKELVLPVFEELRFGPDMIQRHRNMAGNFSIDSAWNDPKDVKGEFKEKVIGPIRGKLAERGIIV